MNPLQLAREIYHLLHETEFGPVADPHAAGRLPIPRPLTRSETRLKNAAAERLANHLTGEHDGPSNVAGGSA
jgi:hypothetical protein